MESYLSSFLAVVLSAFVAHGQKKTLIPLDFDTTNLVVRVCQGDLPGQKKDLNRDYYPQVCAYTYNNNNLVNYRVTAFDLVYIEPSSDSINSDSAKGNRFSPKMRHIITKAKDWPDKLFLDNVTITNKKGEILVIRGRRLLFPPK